jgi:arylsulfatase
MVSHLDRAVGQIVDLIDELGLGQETLILFTSDNGPTHGRVGGADSAFFESAGPLRGLKGSLYEGGIRVPLVARWTGHIAAGATSDQVAAFWDLLPTLCEVTGAETPSECDGVSLLPTFLGEPDRQAQHDYLYWEFPGYGGQQAVRLGDWKAVRQNMLRPDNPDPLRIELYDLAADIGESTDVANQNPEVVAQAERIMREARVPSALFPMAPLDGR